MKRMSVHEAKAHFSAVLRQVEEGETVIVTKHDQPVAKIMPVSERQVPRLGGNEGEDWGDIEDISWTDEELYEMFGEEYGFEPPQK
jgi:prevent-host-death family protein